MALPPSGPITMGMINTELGYPATQIISLNDAAVRALAQVPAGMISLSNFYGKSSVIQKGWYLWGDTGTGSFPSPATAPRGGANSFSFSTETSSAIPISSPTNFANGNILPNQTGHGDTTKALWYGGSPSGLNPGLSFQFATETGTALPALPANSLQSPQWTSNGQKGLSAQYVQAAAQMQFWKSAIPTATLSILGYPTTVSPANSNANYGAAAYSSASLGYAWHIGGQTPATPNINAAFTRKYVFATETETKNASPGYAWVTTLVPSAPNGLYIGVSFCNGSIGYGVRNTAVDKFVLSTETATSGFQSLTAQSRWVSAAINNNTTAWIIGGKNPLGSPSSRFNTIRKYSFTTETLSTAPITAPYSFSSAWSAQGVPQYG